MNPVGSKKPSQFEEARQEQNPSSGITALPQVLLEEIFKSLPPQNLSRIAQTCTSFCDISKTAFSEQKLQLKTFLKRILGTKFFTPEIEQLIDNSKNFKELKSVIENHIWPIECEEFEKHDLLFLQAIATHTQPEDLSTIKLLHEILELSPILYLSNDFCSNLPLETVDTLVDMLIKKHDLDITYLLFKNTFGLGLHSGIFSHSRKLLKYAHEKKSAQDIQYASNRLKDNKEFMLTIIEQCVPSKKTLNTNVYWALEAASGRLKDDIDVVLAAVTKDAHALSLASQRLQSNKDVVLAALKSRIRPFDMTSFIPSALKDDPDILEWT